MGPLILQAPYLGNPSLPLIERRKPTGPYFRSFSDGKGTRLRDHATSLRLNYELLKNPEEIENILPYEGNLGIANFSFGVLEQLVVKDLRFDAEEVLGGLGFQAFKALRVRGFRVLRVQGSERVRGP